MKGVDGWGALVASYGNLIKASAEINEALFPHILRGRNYLTDSGGAGQWRGGCGSHFVKEVRTPTSVNQYVVNQHHTHPGIAGGHNGSPDSCVLSAGTEHERSGRSDGRPALRLETGEPLVYASAAAAGGATRSTATRRRCSRTCGTSTCRSRRARDEYGVVITGSLDDMTLALDAAATAELRAEMRSVQDRLSDSETHRQTGEYRIGVDVGGTFTDCVAADARRVDRAREVADDAVATSPRASWPGWRGSPTRDGLRLCR